MLQAAIEPGDRVCLEGNNQKQADFLARALTALDPVAVHDLHMVQSVLAQQARAGLSGARATPRGQKLVVQMVETFREHMQPAFVEHLDAWTLAEQAKMPLPLIMIYGDDVSHILTEEGIANLLLCRTDEEREQAIRGVAGYTAVGLGRDRRMVENLRDRRVIQRPEDLGIDPRHATRNLLAARSMRDLVDASGGLYAPPGRFRNW